MDPFNASVLAGVIANGLTGVISYLCRQNVPLFNEKREIGAKITSDAILSNLLQQATTTVAKSLAGKSAEDIEKLKMFIVSPEVDAIVRQIYAIKLSKPTMSINSLRNEFEAYMRQRIGKTGPISVDSMNILFDVLIRGCDRALEIAIQKGFLSAHEAKSAARTHLILDELSTIKSMMEFIGRNQQLNIFEIEEFQSRLRSEIAVKHAHIVPPHFDVRRRVPINDLYVTPSFSLILKKRGPQHDRQDVGIEHILTTLYRAVILGNPGSGKSTLANKICHDLAGEYVEKRLGGRRVTPIPLPLREYGRDRKEKNASIVQFIELTCNSTYQISPPERAVEYLLRSGRILIIFDGLDELLDTSYRQKVSADVESFCRLYPGTPVLVTSREVGYEQAPLDEKQFDILRIAPFTESKVEEYVTKWFNFDDELTEPQKHKKVKSFLRESSSVPDLRTNPLMLALMCNIYRGENYIPRNRPDVFEKCAMMLFEKWDKSRDINVSLPFEAHVRPTMMYLAYWVFSDEILQGGVTESALVKKCTEYLYSRRYEDEDEARCAAIEFINFCRGRAWVFTDTGTTKEGENLYQFTHRTFLEYFTAAYLVRTNATPESLGNTLIQHIAAREWDVVAQLAFQLQNKQIEGAGDALVGSVLQLAKTTHIDKERSSLLSFASRTLEFLVPSPSITRDIVVASLEECLSLGSNTDKRENSRKKYVRHDEDILFELMNPLLSSAEDNRTPVSKRITLFLEKGICNEDLLRSTLVLQLCMNLCSFLHNLKRGFDRITDQDLNVYWEKIVDEIMDKNKNRIRIICEQDIDTCLNAVFLDFVTVRQMVAWHGSQSLFHQGNLAISRFFGNPPIIPFIVLNVVEMFYNEDKQVQVITNKWSIKLKESASILCEINPPWLKARGREFMMPHNEYLFHNSSKMEITSLSKMGAHIAFLTFVSYALYIEIIDSSKGKSIEVTVKNSMRFPLFEILYNVRLRKSKMSEFESQMNKCGMSGEPLRLMLEWAAGNVSFVSARSTIKHSKTKFVPESG